MSAIHWSIVFFTLITFSMSAPSWAQDETEALDGLSSQDYGALYVAEKKAEPISSARVSLGYLHEFSNAYLNIDGALISVQRSLNRFVLLGAQGTIYRSESTHLLNALSDQLKKESSSLEAQAPSSSFFGTLGVIPLAGKLDFFGNRPLEFELHVLMGLGTVIYPAAPLFALTWSLKPTVLITSHWSAEVGIGQEVESPFFEDQLTKLQGSVSAGYRF